MSQRNIKTREGYEFWDRLCAIPRYAFLLAPSGNRVQKVEGVGDWIDRHEAQIVVDDAQSEVNVLRSEVEQLKVERDCLKVERDGENERAKMLLKAMNEWADRARAAEAERDALRAEVESLRKDAERYRWICSSACDLNFYASGPAPIRSRVEIDEQQYPVSEWGSAKEELDSAIDAAMATKGDDQ